VKIYGRGRNDRGERIKNETKNKRKNEKRETE
jgi:hypothetical protein